MARNPLDGPGMGYGPTAGNDRRGGSVVTVVLALLCLLLAATLALVLLRPSGQSAAPVVTVTASAPAGSPVPGSPVPSKPAASPAVSGSATPAPRPSASATPGGTDATLRTDEPEGVREAAGAFLRGWLASEPEERERWLSVSATEALLDQVVDVDRAKVPKVKPKGALVVPLATDYSAAADQRMSDGTTVRMELQYEPASRYGWLVDSIEPLE